MRSAPLRLVSLLAALAPACGGADAPQPARSAAPKVAPRPIVLVVIEAWRADHGPGAADPERSPTPFLERLAREGVRFTQAEASSSACLPSLGSLLGGATPREHGLRTHERTLDPGLETLAARLAADGRETAGFTSTPFLHPVFGLGAGFATWRSVHESMRGPELRAALRTPEGLEKALRRARSERGSAARVVDLALEWLDEDLRRERSFFLFLHLADPLPDFLPPREIAERFVPGGGHAFEGFLDEGWEPLHEMPRARALYAAELCAVDRELERFWQRLDSWGLARRTILALTSDHGLELLERGGKGHGHSLHEELTHVPLFLHAPELVRPGLVVEAPVPSWDLAPTLLDLAGLAPWPGREGRSLRPAWESPERFEARPFAQELVDARGGVLLAWRDGASKLTWDPARGRGALHELALDPKERAPRPLESPDAHPFVARLLAAVGAESYAAGSGAELEAPAAR